MINKNVSMKKRYWYFPTSSPTLPHLHLSLILVYIFFILLVFILLSLSLSLSKYFSLFFLPTHRVPIFFSLPSPSYFWLLFHTLLNFLHLKATTLIFTALAIIRCFHGNISTHNCFKHIWWQIFFLRGNYWWVNTSLHSQFNIDTGDLNPFDIISSSASWDLFSIKC